MPKRIPMFLWSTVLTCFWIIGSSSVRAAAPAGLFTNLAERLLQRQFGFGVTQIEISPSNQYTPSVHRLLQVAANLYDATSDSPDSLFPSVFRPLFKTNGSVFICGYTNDSDASTARTSRVPPP